MLFWWHLQCHCLANKRMRCFAHAPGASELRRRDRFVRAKSLHEFVVSNLISRNHYRSVQKRCYIGRFLEDDRIQYVDRDIIEDDHVCSIRFTSFSIPSLDRKNLRTDPFHRIHLCRIVERRGSYTVLYLFPRWGKPNCYHAAHRAGLFILWKDGWIMPNGLRYSKHWNSISLVQYIYASSSSKVHSQRFWRSQG